MLHIVDNLCARLRTVHDVAGMQEALSEVAKVIELPHYAYIGYPDSAELAPLVIETYPDGWAKRYVEQRYDLLDPIVHRSKGSLVPFEWSCHEEMKTANRSQRRFLREAIRYGIVSGYTVPVQDGCRGASLSFACDRVIEYGSGVQLVAHLTAIYIHQRAVDLARGGKPAPKLPPFLTRREQEVLQWTGSGKTAAETGQILGCTARTIEHHLIKAREKLGVATSRQAVAVAVRHGLVAVPEAGR